MSHDDNITGDRDGCGQQGTYTPPTRTGDVPTRKNLDGAVIRIRQRADRRFAVGKVILIVGLGMATVGLGYLALMVPPGGARPVNAAVHPVVALLSYPPFGLAIVGLALTMVGTSLVLTAPELHAIERRRLFDGFEE